MRRQAAAAAVVCAALVTAACSGATQAATTPPTSPSAVSSSASPSPSPSAPPVAPLTGLPSTASLATEPAVAVLVAGSQTQGLSDADVTYEEVTSPLRYIAVFQSKAATVVGPVTGTRPADGEILAVLRPMVAYDGGTSSFISVLDHTNVVDVGYGTHSSLYSDGAAGLTTSTTALQGAGQTGAPPQLFAYRGAVTGSDALASTGQWRATAVTIQFPSGFGTQQWTFDAAQDLWQQTAGGPPVAVANLVIQTVPYINVFLSRKYGATVPSARVLGRGASKSVEAFTGIADSSARGPGGLAAYGQWSKPGPKNVTQFLDEAGLPMDFQPGPTWIVLAPPGTQVTVTNAPS